MKKILAVTLFVFLFIAVGLAAIPKFFSNKMFALSCFPAGTKITMADNTERNIEDVKVGDRVLSQSESGNKSVSTVKGLDRPIRDHMCKINFADGKSLKLTQEHPMLTTSGWKAIEPNKDAYDDPNLVVGTLKSGDGVIKLDHAPAIVTSVSCWPEKVQVYNLLLHGMVNTYFADGFLAHNRFSPTANFKKAERNALRNGYSVAGQSTKFNSASYVANLFLQGKLIDPNNAQNLSGVQLAAATVSNAVEKYNQQNPGALGSNYAANLLNALTSGAGLSQQQISVLYGIPFTQGTTSTGTTYANIPGFYGVFPAGCFLETCEVFYPIGTGPNAATAKEGDVIIPPPPPGTIQARAVTMATIPETCDQIKEATPSTTFRSGTQFDLKLGAVSQGVKTQSGSSYVSWSLQPNTYTVAALSPGTSSIRYCLTDSTGSHFGVSTDNLASSVTDTFDVAYGPPPAWFQAQGGDVYAATNISALTPVGVSPRQFLLSGTGGYPGVVTYGGASTDYDFSSDDGTKGEAYVSSKNWLANDVDGNRDFYSYFYSKLGSPTSPDYTNLTDPLPQPASDSGRPIYVQGNLTTSGNWTVADGQKYVFLVNGALTLGGKITITGNGFIAFIVKNDITIASSVGGAYNSIVPVVEGIYLSSGTIHTGFSSVPGAERFVGRGMFVANHVALERDLTSINQNAAYPSELFIYNPALLVNLPDTMKNVPVSWQEVAP